LQKTQSCKGCSLSTVSAQFSTIHDWKGLER
jgi:hypothetical protein